MSTGRRRPGWLLPTVLVVVLLAGVGAAVVLLRAPQLLPGPPASVVPVVRADVVTEIRVPGSVRSAGDADVSFATSGVVATIDVAPGAVVAAGDVLATLDDGAVRAQVTAAETAVAADDSDLTAARDAVPADPALVGRLEAAAARDRAELAEANRRLEGTVLRAPRSGTVTAVTGQVGDRVGAGVPGPDDAAGSRPFVRLADLNELVVLASVAPRDVPRVATGQPASALVDGVGDPVLGEVVGVEPAPGPDGSYAVAVAAPLPPPTLRVGQAADVRVVVDRAVGVLVVPPAAVRPGAPGQGTVLVRPPDDRRGADRVVAVTTGLADATSVEIETGLREGDRVVVPRDADPGPRP